MKENIISKILEHTYRWIQYKKKNIPLSTFFNKIKKSEKFFENIFKKKNPSFILECKKASPLTGIIKKNFHISEIISTYNKYADVISIITEEKFFHGNFEYLLKASTQTKKLLLCKDFIIDPYQIYYARYHQADAILLMLSILDDKTYITLANLAKQMNLGILTEIHSLNELKRALKLNATVIGINNRNLKNLSINTDNTKNLVSYIPKNKIIICESGINNYSQVRSMSGIVNGFLIGTHLMKSKNLERSVKKIIYGNNKICGLTNVTDAQYANEKGFVYGGLIFISRSPRYVDNNASMRIVMNTQLQYIGVFKNEKPEYILNQVNQFNLYAIQLHGNESLEFIIKLKKILPIHVKIWKAISMNYNTIIHDNILINRYLLDNKNGGTGRTFNWDLIKKFNISNMMLAGGLNIKNSFLASTLGFKGLDFNSGLEKYPGKKDSKKIKKVFKILRFYPKKNYSIERTKK